MSVTQQFKGVSTKNKLADSDIVLLLFGLQWPCSFIKSAIAFLSVQTPVIQPNETFDRQELGKQAVV